jgi:O-antigen/teichoic acid export membrane protein
VKLLVLVIKNAFWLSVCRFAADFSGLLLFTVISRSLGPWATGQYSYSFALGAFIAILASSGLEQYGIRQYSRLNSAAERTACWRGMLLVQSLQLLCGLVLLLLVTGFLEGRNASPGVILEVAIFLIGWGLSQTFFVPANARQAMTTPAFLELACRAAGILSAVVLCLLGVRSLEVMLVGLPIAGGVLAALAWRNAVSHGAAFDMAASWTDFVATVKSAVPFTLCEILGQFYVRADLLLVAQLLGSVSAGLYAADLKVVEVGVTPLVFLGTAAYPLLSRTALHDRIRFLALAEELLRGVLFVGGWLAVGMSTLVPLLIPIVLGQRFEPAVHLLPLFSMLAITKGLEIAVYRMLYATRMQTTYLIALMVGTLLIVALNWWLIPVLGAKGAITAIVVSTAIVDGVAIARLRSEIHLSVFALALARLALPLACTAVVFMSLRATGLNEWCVAVGACLAYPVLGWACGLMPHPRRSLLFA